MNVIIGSGHASLQEAECQVRALAPLVHPSYSDVELVVRWHHDDLDWFEFALK